MNRLSNFEENSVFEHVLMLAIVAVSGKPHDDQNFEKSHSTRVSEINATHGAIVMIHQVKLQKHSIDNGMTGQGLLRDAFLLRTHERPRFDELHSHVFLRC